jgi:hypothetical protein
MRVRGDLQHLLQRRRIEFQPGFDWRLIVRLAVTLPRFSPLARDFPPTGFQTVPPIRQAERSEQFQVAAADAAQLPCPCNTLDGALGSGDPVMEAMAVIGGLLTAAERMRSFACLRRDVCTLQMDEAFADSAFSPASKVECPVWNWNCRRGRVAGVDEAGRGPLAGPVVAAAVVLGPGCPRNWLTCWTIPRS